MKDLIRNGIARYNVEFLHDPFLIFMSFVEHQIPLFSNTFSGVLILDLLFLAGDLPWPCSGLLLSRDLPNHVRTLSLSLLFRAFFCKLETLYTEEQPHPIFRPDLRLHWIQKKKKKDNTYKLNSKAQCCRNRPRQRRDRPRNLHPEAWASSNLWWAPHQWGRIWTPEPFPVATLLYSSFSLQFFFFFFFLGFLFLGFLWYKV